MIVFTALEQKVHSARALRRGALAADKHSKYSGSTSKRCEAIQKHIAKPGLKDYDNEVTALGRRLVGENSRTTRKTSETVSWWD